MKLSRTARFSLAVLVLGAVSLAAPGLHAQEKEVWKPVPFLIVRYNDEAPKDWNVYHSDRKGLLLLRLWKRYLLIDVSEQEVYDIDPQKIKAQGENVEWSLADVPDFVVHTSEWKARSAGPVERVRFRFGTSGNFLEIQLPLKPDGKPRY